MIAITGPAFCFAFGGPCSGTNVAAYNAEYDVADWTGYVTDFPIYGDGSSMYGMVACHAGATTGF
ncbi:MAG: hypothetical protein M3071_19030 [Actinomycetota bacterium]|nr:hypothetical protein [Actinomycetota bacterium]